MQWFRGHRLPSMLILAIIAIFSISSVASATSTTLRGEVKIEVRHSKKVTWSIDKSVTPEVHNLKTGESAKSTYTVMVDRVKTNRHGKVWGEICVTNTGTKFATKNLSVKARLRLGNPLVTVTTKTLDVSSNPVLDPGESACYPFEFKLTGSQFATGTPVRVVGIIRITNYVGHYGSVYGINPYTSSVMPAPTVYNGSVTIDDTWKGELGVITNDKTFTYDRWFECDKDEGTYPNTATIKETGQSDSASVTVNCEPPPNPGCTLTQGYWKNHEDSWPVSSLKLGDVSYTQAELLSIFDQSVGGNGLISLAHQLIAAKLNVANGADDSAIQSAIDDADDLIGSLVVPPVGSGSLTTAETSSLVEALTDFNEGTTGPGHCDD